VVLCEAINRLLIFVAVESAGVVVSILLLYHFTLLVVKKLQALINVLQPRVSKNLLNRKSFVRVDFKKAS